MGTLRNEKCHTRNSDMIPSLTTTLDNNNKILHLGMNPKGYDHLRTSYHPLAWCQSQLGFSVLCHMCDGGSAGCLYRLRVSYPYQIPDPYP